MQFSVFVIISIDKRQERFGACTLGVIFLTKIMEIAGPITTDWVTTLQFLFDPAVVAKNVSMSLNR